ncbi:MAG: hypothetical protein IIY82_07915 [Firmicutes bacterium]|nr:hypothetical protein [Bacillota bacterium]
MKKSLKILLGALVGYVILLLLLVAVEHAAPGTSIRSIWDALWYSLITMTTVGYGDLAPVTGAGRVLGVIFALASIGILAALISLGMKVLSGELLPRLRLLMGKSRPWAIFDSEKEDAVCLSWNLQDKNPDLLCIFPEEGVERHKAVGVIRTDLDEEELAARHAGKDGLRYFLLGPDGWANYTNACRVAACGIPVCCLTDVRVENVPAGLTLFSREEAIARCYWNEHPLTAAEKTVVLIGCGRIGSRLLEQGLLVNVFPGSRRTTYHVFADRSGFATLHPELMKALTTGMTPAIEPVGGNPDGDGFDWSGETVKVQPDDRLVFHTGSRGEVFGILQEADRIILCFDRDEENLEAYEELRTWYPLSAAVHVRLEAPQEGVITFGERERIFTEEYVLKAQLDRQAMHMHEIYSEGAANPVAWRDLSPFLRQSNLAAADHLLVKARLLLDDEPLTELTEEDCRRAYERYQKIPAAYVDVLREAEHRRWVRFHQMYNWTYAPVRDNGKRQHPLLVPYTELPEEERVKDDFAWEMLGRFAGIKEPVAETEPEEVAEAAETETVVEVAAEPVAEETAEPETVEETAEPAAEEAAEPEAEEVVEPAAGEAAESVAEEAAKPETEQAVEPEAGKEA